MIEVALFGAGRIGAIHASNVVQHADSRLRRVVDVNLDAARQLAGSHGVEAGDDVAAALADPQVTAVVIASSTDTHVDLIVQAARAGKAIFCEKPVDNSLARVEAAEAAVHQAGVPCLIAFNRRFDPQFRRLHDELRGGAVGAVEMVTLTSRDPAPPPLDYIKVSGGLFRDMMIHDLDMARWLLGEEPVSLFASGSCLVDPAIGAAGDVDSAVVVLRTATGQLCQISNSRRACYGYDQRIEVHGAGGMLQAGNLRESTLQHFTEDGVVASKPLHFFLERYAEAYRAEWDHFVGCVQHGRLPTPGVEDGRRALVLAEAAQRSLQSGAAVEIS